MIDELSQKQFVELYKTRIMRDFPPGERRPLFSIRRLMRQGRYTCLVLREEGEILAYAGFLHDKNIPAVLMDYFAVEEGRRGGGIGSRFLKELRGRWNKDGVIIECELPEKAYDGEERKIRERRIAFYVKNGARVMPWGLRIFSVDYRLLWMPGEKEQGDAEDVCKLYALSMPKGMLEKYMHLYPLTD